MAADNDRCWPTFLMCAFGSLLAALLLLLLPHSIMPFMHVPPFTLPPCFALQRTRMRYWCADVSFEPSHWKVGYALPCIMESRPCPQMLCTFCGSDQDMLFRRA
jgi:hypothetical protein